MNWAFVHVLECQRVFKDRFFYIHTLSSLLIKDLYIYILFIGFRYLSIYFIIIIYYLVKNNIYIYINKKIKENKNSKHFIHSHAHFIILYFSLIDDFLEKLEILKCILKHLHAFCNFQFPFKNSKFKNMIFNTYISVINTFILYFFFIELRLALFFRKKTKLQENQNK